MDVAQGAVTANNDEVICGRHLRKNLLEGFIDNDKERSCRK